MPACSIYVFFFIYTYTHMHSKALSTCTYSTLSEYWTLWMHQVITWQLQIPAVRYNQFHLHLPCLLLHIFLVIVIGMNGLSDLIMGIVNGPECKKALCECINTKMVYQLLCVRLQKHPQKVGWKKPADRIKLSQGLKKFLPTQKRKTWEQSDS